VIDLLIDGSQMRQFVHQSFEAVALRAASYQNRFTILNVTPHTRMPNACWITVFRTQ
jgi:hypothetical protein